MVPAATVVSRVDWSTVPMLSWTSRVPFAAAQLCRMLKFGMPDFFGEFHGWRFLPDGTIWPPGWGEPIHRQDVVSTWFYRGQSARAASLENEVLLLRKELLFYRGQTKTRAALGCVYATADVIKERG